MNNTPLSALVLLGVASVVTGVVWFAAKDDGQATDTRPVQSEVAAAPRVMDLTPHELRKQKRLEMSLRQIEEYKKIGKVLPNGAIKVPDVEGSFYVHPELFKGVGRYGEPLYLMAKYKFRAPVPLRDEVKSRIKSPDAQPKIKRVKEPLSFGKKPANSAADGAGDSGSNSEEDGGDSSDKKGGGGVKDD